MPALFLGCALATGLYAGALELPASNAVAARTATIANLANTTRFELEASEALLAQAFAPTALSHSARVDSGTLARELDRMATFVRVLHQCEERLLRRADLRSGQTTQRLESAGLPGRVNASKASFASAILPHANPGRVLRDVRYRPLVGSLRMSAGTTRDAGVLQDHRRDLHLHSLRNGAVGDDGEHSNVPVIRNLSATAGAGFAIACVQPCASLLASPFSSLSLSTFSLSIHRPAIAPASVFATRYHFAQASASAPDFRYLTTVSVGFLSGEFA